MAMSRFTQFIGHCYQEYCLHSSESECNKNVHENFTTMQDHSIKVHKQTIKESVLTQFE